ncbi:uncharacterized protein PAC_02662 [Phialocephala subalpina]|uniref:Protein mms22 n=1 Tax=Phialocephala subalpina TaxID=576137 RepID=A0A1L7WJ20_9HELO|nr:uncharacterized protein PAC_02662 [Phialocephala subalpina]
MASWKEKGEVPDSDDEWDIESQRNKQDGGVHEPELENTAEIDDENAIETENEERIPSQYGAEQSQELLPQDTSANDEASPPEAYEAASTPTNEVDAPLPQIWSSPDLARVFKIPDLEGLSDEEDALRIDARRAQMPATDDISRSYVRITSPLSTQPSSPPGSLPELPPLPRTKSGTTSTLDSLDIETAPPEEHIYESNGQDVETGSNYPMKRSLRQRNAIQLHPYVVEQEKYRRTLKSRGIAPMRLASSQIEPRHAPRKSSSPDPDFQEQETQEVEGDTGESQAMELDWDPPPSSSPVQPVGNQNQNVIDNGDEDEDKKDDNLPDIDELLRSRQQPSGKPDLKRRRIKSYSHKFKRPVLPRILTQPRAPRTTDNGNPIFDVPASPPATSSPFPNPVAHGRVGASRGEPRSLEPTPSLLSQEDIYVQRSVDLPMPATSAIKPPLEPISLTSESESDDPFASDVENSLASSSSDESVQIRKISKKIRGVLPASHLRLDQKNKPQPLSRTNRDSRSASPARMMPRRGVALPRTQSGTLGQQRSLSAATSTGFSFFSDDEDDENDEDGLIMENNPASQLESLFPESRMGFAEEEDKIDAMLPSRKRQSTTSSRPSKKRKTRSSSFLRTGSGTHRRQPKIIDHLGKASKPSSGMKLKSHRPKGKGRKNAAGPRKPSPPALGILDVTDVFPDRQGTSPDFIRIAARAARARTAQGRHKPAGKFFRLSTREDTEDVQSVLQDWTAGKLQPRNLSEISKHKTQAIRGPLSHIHNNQQTRFDPSISKARPAMQVNPLESSRKARRLLVSRRQQSMSDFVRKDPTPQDPIRLSVQSQPSHNIDLGAQRRPRFQHHSARPAQLEGSENDYSHRYPSTTFKSSKIALDALYRGTRKRPIPSANLQLSRFLADEDVVRPSIENRSSAECDVLEEAADNTSKRQRARKVGRQKQQPRLVDVGAAVYRQPTDPLILDCFATEAAADASDSKLQGLAKFGTRYTQNFDILPLPPGVFFHASTFVGSGRLSEILRDLRAQRLSPTPIVVSLNLAKTFSWGPWDENVSSEVGLCFDWLVDQLELDSSLPSSCLATAVMDVVMSVLEYMQQSLTFSGPLNETMFLSRMLEVLRDFCSRLRVSHITSHADVQKGVQVLSRICTLTFRLLCVARAKQEYAALSFEFENVLKSTAHKCSQLLLSQDLSVLRKLYDDLQYLSFRDGGIRRDQYAAEAWVILIQVLAAAKISRGSFWDVVGPVLTTADVARTIDAPTMEKMWYSMYTLLPLCEFDEHGVIIQGARRLASFDNWQLPQQMLKRIFSLYKSNPRQSPGFNEYCRSIVSRCHYLMVEWGWWKCSAVIGTVFDFFASQKLAHLRNEEVYTSPHFLEEFDQNPTLAVEPEDRCFHIFLKIVALALKQFSHVGDVKSIRNLVARLLPNHDRQYPKDEAIHQKDLASLRNHHDLLCTMFWASTSAQRPSLATIENLVERGRSHKEAFLVHIRAHANLARFAFSSNQEMEVYTRLNDWQEKDVSSLIDVHRNAELEIRNQAEEGTTEAQISEIVSSNKIQIEAQIFTLLAVWALNIGVTLSLHHAITVLNAHALAKTLSFARTNDRVLGLSINFKVLHQCLTIIDAYAEKVEEFRPEAQQQEGSTEDSQDSIGEVVEYMANRILPLREKSEIPSLYDFLALLARDCLAQEPEGDEEITLTHLVRTWARVVMLFVGTATPDVEKYVIFGRFAVFENREKYKTAKKYWPFFLANLLRHSNDLDYFRIPSFNLELQWLLVLIDPHAVKSFEIDLTNQMVAKGSYLCKSIDTDKASAVVKFKGAVSTMNAILTRSSSQSTNNLPFENAGPVFSDMIRSVETAMQKNLISMEPGSREHKEYLSKVQDVIAHTKAFGRTFWRPSLFFSERSAHYWPDEADPHQFGPTLISYCLRLETEPEKASSEMFFFLYYQWETHVKSHNIKAYIHHLRECTKYWSLVRFMLADLIPVTLQASFKTHSWVLCFHFMQAVVGRVRHILDDSIEKCEFKSVDQLEDKKQKAEWVYTKVLNILAFGADAPGFSKSTLAVLVDFWYSLDYSLRMHNRNELGDRLEPPYGANNVLERFLAASCGFSNDFHHRIQVQTSEHLDSESIVKELINATEKGWELCHVHGQTYVVKSKDSKSDGWVRLPFTAEHVLRSTYRRG